jgi:hypothetical protein
MRWCCILLKSMKVIFHIQKGEVLQFVKINVFSDYGFSKEKKSCYSFT